MTEIDSDKAQAQIRVQAMMHSMLQSLVVMMAEKVDNEMSEYIDEDDFDLIMAMCFIKAAIDVSLQAGASKESFFKLCGELYDVVEFHMSVPVGNA